MQGRWEEGLYEQKWQIYEKYEICPNAFLVKKIINLNLCHISIQKTNVILKLFFNVIIMNNQF